MSSTSLEDHYNNVVFYFWAIIAGVIISIVLIVFVASMLGGCIGITLKHIVEFTVYLFCCRLPALCPVICNRSCVLCTNFVDKYKMKEVNDYDNSDSEDEVIPVNKKVHV